MNCFLGDDNLWFYLPVHWHVQAVHKHRAEYGRCDPLTCFVNVKHRETLWTHEPLRCGVLPGTHLPVDTNQIDPNSRERERERAANARLCWSEPQNMNADRLRKAELSSEHTIAIYRTVILTGSNLWKSMEIFAPLWGHSSTPTHARRLPDLTRGRNSDQWAVGKHDHTDPMPKTILESMLDIVKFKNQIPTAQACKSCRLQPIRFAWHCHQLLPLC